MELHLVCLTQPIPSPPTRRTRVISTRGRSVRTWPLGTNEVQVGRLTDFLRVVRAALNEGTDEEKEIAERILVTLWHRARNLERQLPRPGTAKPVQKTVSRQLVERLEREAWENLKEGESEGFLSRARQALVAGASHNTRNSFAWTLATSWRDEVWNPELAEEWAREAINQGGRSPAYLDTLAASLAGQGKFEEALELELEILQKLKDEKPGPFTARAILYLSEKPYRQRPPGERE